MGIFAYYFRVSDLYKKEMPLRTVKIIVFFFLLLTNIYYFTPANAMAIGNSTNTPESIIIFWTDGPKLKAVNLTFFPDHAGPIGIISVPIYTWITSNQTTTVSEYYYEHGREKFIQQMEILFKRPISAHITIDQKALINVSKVIGNINMADKETTLQDVFEGNYTDGPVNLQVEIRQLADAMMTPAVILKLPEIIWVFSKQVESTIGPRHVMAFYRVLLCRGPEILQKKALPGSDYIIGNRKYRRVEPDTWPKTLIEVTS